MFRFARGGQATSGQSTCFYCLTPVASSSDARINHRSFRCDACGCWNRLDPNGNILSDEPAMHDEELNKGSFAVRGSSSKTTFPSLQNNNPPFCHSCRTNQTLQVNLLAGYLPPPSDKQYRALLAQLPTYKQSLEVRYPSICDDCRPAVEEVIQRKDQMARTAALGGWLSETKRRAETAKRRDEPLHARVQFNEERKKASWIWRQLLGPEIEGVEFRRTMSLWRMEACLWFFALCASLCMSISVVFGQVNFSWYTPYVALFFALCSYLGSKWDPTFARVRQGRAKGIEVAFIGRDSWLNCQRKSWLLRVLAASLWVWYGDSLAKLIACCLLGCEVMFLAWATYAVRVVEHHKPRTVYSRASSVAPQPPSTDSINILPNTTHLATNSLSSGNILSALSLSGDPVDFSTSSNLATLPASAMEPPNLPKPKMKTPASIHHPVFGQTSLAPDALVVGRTPGEQGCAEMDWEPSPDYATLSPANSLKPVGSAYRPMESEEWIKPAKFFAKEQPTGLEALFERVDWFGAGEDDTREHDNAKIRSTARWFGRLRASRVLVAGVLGVSIGLVLKQTWMLWS